MRLSPTLDPANRSADVEIVIDNATLRLKPGMFATIFMAVAQRAQALTIPKRALTLDRAEPTVYRVQDGRAQLTTLTLGEADGDRIEVRSGLREGDRVVVVGQDQLLDGGLVRVVDEDSLPRVPVSQ